MSPVHLKMFNEGARSNKSVLEASMIFVLELFAKQVLNVSACF